MPTKPLSEETAREAVLAVEQSLTEGYRPRGVRGQGRGAVAEASRRLGLKHVSTMDTRLRTGANKYGLQPDWKLYRPAAKPDHPPIVIPEEQDKKDILITRQAGQLSELKASLKKARETIVSLEDIRAGVFGLSKQNLDGGRIDLTPSKKRGAAGLPVLFTSDFQWGEVIDPAELDGINAYDLDIAAERYATLIETTVRLCYEYPAGEPDYPALIYLRGGDAISGAIHDELAETDADTPLGCVADLARTEVAGIRILAEKFGRVIVISIPGNHGRTTIKRRAKKYALHNFETSLAWMIEAAFDGDDRVQFWTPKSGDAHFSLYGYWFLLTHGDRIGTGGGQGFIGPSATIARGMQKTWQQYSRLGRPLDYIMCGHFHTTLQMPMGYANGALAGYSEFAQQIRANPEPAQQTLLFVHPDRGVVDQRQIVVGGAVKPKPQNAVLFETPQNHFNPSVKKEAA